MLNGRMLAEQGVITNVSEDNIAQHGIDLNLLKVERFNKQVVGRVGIKKTLLVDYEEVPVIGGLWVLESGTYSVTFTQGCKIPSDKMLLIRQRSSLLRNGTILHSSVFDAGFTTDNMGTVMVVTHPIVIEEGARIAQIYGHNCIEIKDSDLYGAKGKGSQFQNDSQRDK